MLVNSVLHHAPGYQVPRAAAGSTEAASGPADVAEVQGGPPGAPAHLAHTAGCTCCHTLSGMPGSAPVQGALICTGELRERLDALPGRPEEVTHVLYHADCFDGFGACYAAWKALGDKATYIPVAYHQPPPQLPPDAKVAIVDFSYPREQLEQMKASVANLVVLDHHKSAQEQLQGIPYAVFDMGRAGAGLSWEYFHRGQPEPLLLQYVEDRDLWRFQLPQSKEVQAALSSYPRDLQVWDSLDPVKLREEGVPLLRWKQLLVEANAQRARLEIIDGVEVPVVNTTAELRSEVGHEMLKNNPRAPFVALYFDDEHGDRQWSLRSKEKDPNAADVSVIARKFGGGGHANAAGFTRREGSPWPDRAPAAPPA